MIKNHRRHFQLLELLVAVSILLLCIGPTIRIFTNIYKGQQQIIRENLRDHIANRVHAAFTEALYKREIELSENEAGAQIAIKDPDILELLRTSHCMLSGVFHVTSLKKDGKEFKHLCTLNIQLEDQFPILTGHVEKDDKYDPAKSKYEYVIYITRSASESEPTTDNVADTVEKINKNTEQKK